MTHGSVSVDEGEMRRLRIALSKAIASAVELEKEYSALEKSRVCDQEIEVSNTEILTLELTRIQTILRDLVTRNKTRRLAHNVTR